MTDDQRQQWKDALAAAARSKHGDRGRRYRQLRTGLAGVRGAGRIRVRTVLPDVDDGQGDDTNQTSAAEVAAASPPTEE